MESIVECWAGFGDWEIQLGRDGGFIVHLAGKPTFEGKMVEGHPKQWSLIFAGIDTDFRLINNIDERKEK